MFYDKKVENWVIIIDTEEVSLLSFPFKILKPIFDFSSLQFMGNLESIYILNPSFSLNTAWHIIESK